MILPKLDDSYPFTANSRDSVSMIFFIGFFVALFVMIFKSSLMGNQVALSIRIGISISFGFSVIVITQINMILLTKLVSETKRREWKKIHELLFYLVQFASIAITNLILNHYFFHKSLSFLDISKSIFYTITIGGLAVTMYLLWNKGQDKIQSLDVNSMIEKKKLTEPNIPISNFGFLAKDVLFIESQKNYLLIHLKNGQTKKIRSTLKKMEADLSHYPFISRCHKSYLVNINMIKTVKGNLHGKIIFFENKDTIVPVSRSFTNQFN